jgi:spore maturation protein CgeB
MTRVLFVGFLGKGQTSGMRCMALRRLGHDVAAVDAGAIWRGSGYLTRQLAQSTLHGSRIDELNRAVVKTAAEHRPALVWAEKQEYLRPETIERLRVSGAVVLHYNPDPYFSLAWKRNALTDACLPLYDVLVVTKRYELESYRLHCRGRIAYSPLGYDPIGHASPTAKTPRNCGDVVFVGGWEPRRERLLSSARDLTDTVRVWGYGWRIAQGTRANPLRALRLGRLAPGRAMYFGAPSRELAPTIGEGECSNGEIYEETYSKVVAGSRIALGLVRAICPDEHTTRTFEIPAIGGFMLADRTSEHLELFEEGKEAEYFVSDEEFRDKLKFYLANDAARDRISRAGHERCMRSGYSYDDRIRSVLKEIEL